MQSINQWIEKYRPKTICDIIGNEEKINSITYWLKNYDSQKEKYMREFEEKNEKAKNKKQTKKSKTVQIEDTENAEIVEIAENIENVEIENYEIANIPVAKSKAKSCLLIRGNHGIGKTAIVKAILDDMDYDYEIINIYSVSSHKNIEEKINKIFKGINVLDEVNGVQDKNRKKAIIIDKLETISTQIEKNFVESILRENDKNWVCPIIFISSMKHVKLLTSLKNFSLVIILDCPLPEHMNILFCRIAKGEKIRFDPDGGLNTINKIREHAQSDYQRLIYILYDLKKNAVKNLVTKAQVEEYCNMSKTKDTDIDIYKSAAELILKYPGMNECLRLYSGEKVILPLMIHQNYPKCLTEYKNNLKNPLELAARVAESISMGDIIENYIYSEQNWDMQDVHCFYTCVNPSFNLSKANIDVSLGYLGHHLKFAEDLNRTSIKQINKKNVVNANVYMKNMDINDFIYANTLTKKLMDDKKYEECANLYKDYGANADTIASVLKIDKINNDENKIKAPGKNKYQTNTKKLFNKFLV